MSEKYVWSGRTTSYSHKGDDWRDRKPDGAKGVRKEWFLDVQWSTCPVEVQDQVRDLWRLHELANDHYIIKASISDLEELADQGFEAERWNKETIKYDKIPLKTDAIIQYLKEQGVGEVETVIIHWWW